MHLNDSGMLIDPAIETALKLHANQRRKGSRHKVLHGFWMSIPALTKKAEQPKSFLLSANWEKRLRVPTGFLTGFINGLTGSQVMPVLPYLFSLNLDIKTFVQAINFAPNAKSRKLGSNTLSASTFSITSLPKRETG